MSKLKFTILLLGVLLSSSSFMVGRVSKDTCPSKTYDIYFAFGKILADSKYKCYGRAISEYQAYYCPKFGVSCQGTYVQQTFCYSGEWYNLYHTEKKCTCGCVGKNFHGKNLNILDVRPCVCDDDVNEEIIGKEDF